MRNTFLLLLCSLVLGHSKQKEKPKQIDIGKTLKLTSTLKLPLDERSVQKTANLQYFTESGQSYLAHFNKLDNSIKILSLEKRSLTQSIQLNRIGPNAIIGMDSSPENFKIITPDSIYIYSTFQEKIFLINSNGEIRNTWQIPISSLGPKYPSAKLNTLCSLMPFKDYMILTSQISWYDDGQPPLSIIPTTSGQAIERKPEGLALYQQFDVSKIGNSDFFKASNTITKDSLILVNFPLDHRILTLNTKLEVQYHELINPKLGTLKGFGEKITAQSANTQEYFDFQGTAAVYHSIIADPYNGLIFRLARLPFSMEEVRKIRNGGESKSWDYSVMIYNNDFKLIGEKTLVNTMNYYMHSLFVSPEGLHIQRISENEDEILFDVFNITEAENKN